MKIHITQLLTCLLMAVPVVGLGQSFDPLQLPDVVLGSRVTNRGAIRQAEDIAVDEVRRKVYVADSALHRVLRFSMDEAGKIAGEAEVVLGQVGFTQSTTAPAISDRTFNRCSGVCVDAEGRLWVADTGNNRVLRFDNASQKGGNVPADGVLGQPSFTTDTATKGAFAKLWQPRGVAAGPKGELYVADTGNHRVVRYDNAASKMPGVGFNGVIGQINQTASDPYTTRHRMRSPTGLYLHHFTIMGGTITWLWVADSGNNRVMMFTNPHLHNASQDADKIFGQVNSSESTPGAGRHGMNRPVRLAGALGQLWVADAGNNRVLRFDTATAKPDFNAAADSVFGQSDMTSTASGTQLRYMDSPAGLAASQDGSLWVGDVGNRRVLHFQNTPQLLIGASASSVLGANLPGTFDVTMTPNGLTIDRQTGQLFVADTFGNRVLRYKNHAALTTGAQPEAVFGQPNFTTTQARVAQDGLNGPTGIHIDDSRSLWVADTGNNRILRFSNAHTAPSGPAADKVLGQAKFSSVETPNAPRSINLRSPQAVWYHQNNLFVADTGHHRVLLYQQVNQKAYEANADRVWGQVNYSEARTDVVSAGSMNSPRSLCVTPAGDLWVADWANRRVLGFRDALGTFRRDASVVLGQASFTENQSSGMSSQQRVIFPTAVAVDAAGRLWVADGNSGGLPDRLKCYENERSLPALGGLPAFPLGQQVSLQANGNETWSTGSIRHTLVDITPTAIVPDPVGGGVWVASGPRSRVTHYSPRAEQGGQGGQGEMQVTCGLNNAGHFYLTFNTTPLLTYRIESSPDLRTWTTVATLIADSDTKTWTDPQPAGATGRKFFRVVPPDAE